MSFMTITKCGARIPSCIISNFIILDYAALLKQFLACTPNTKVAIGPKINNDNKPHKIRSFCSLGLFHSVANTIMVAISHKMNPITNSSTAKTIPIIMVNDKLSGVFIGIAVTLTITTMTATNVNIISAIDIAIILLAVLCKFILSRLLS